MSRPTSLLKPDPAAPPIENAAGPVLRVENIQAHFLTHYFGVIPGQPTPDPRR